MKMYKLKKEAKIFFKHDLHEKIKSIEFWNNEKIHENLLQEVDNVFVEYGIKTSECSSQLKGWNSNDGNPKAHFHFTVHVSNIDSERYDKVSIPEMMDEMQKVVNKYFDRL